ncbi:hypothetical protein KDM87_14070 [Undibacterium sp. FT147W]|uniref:DUF4129 domain-containing protein n=1 Tax=Undibacterium rivi TaxID=2828729 RepID=A0ABS5H4A0_9BURK|nr:hypothetical protein [Undibacterium rivi]MBR7793721.1 hypothetical protein [Undibacterium rivi]
MKLLTAAYLELCKTRIFLLISLFFIVPSDSFAGTIKSESEGKPQTTLSISPAEQSSTSAVILNSASPSQQTEFATESLQIIKGDLSKIVPIILSIISILMSIGLTIYNVRKDNRARKLSIEDDYWIRKVISPIAIEPLLKILIEMTAATPQHYGMAGFDKTKLRPFHDQYKSKLLDLQMSLSSLSLIDGMLAKKAKEGLDSIDEQLIEFCFSNERGVTGKHTTRTEFQALIREEMMKILKLIKDYQSHLK